MAEEKLVRSQADRPEATRERYRFGVPQAKLAVNKTDPAFHYHWINDYPGRIEQAQAGGYEFVKKSEVSLLPGVTSRDMELGDRVSVVVGVRTEGGPLHAYLMKIKREWWEENQEMLLEQPRAIERAIRAGRTTGQETPGVFYVPGKSPIKMESKLTKGTD